MNNQLIWSLGAAAATIVAARLHHVHKRKNECRCPQCGSRRVVRSYFMEPTLSARWKSDLHRCYDTYALMSCEKCGNVRVKSDTRYLSTAALWWRRQFHPSHFDLKGKVYARLIELKAIPGSAPLPLSPFGLMAAPPKKIVISPAPASEVSSLPRPKVLPRAR